MRFLQYLVPVLILVGCGQDGGEEEQSSSAGALTADAGDGGIGVDAVAPSDGAVDGGRCVMVDAAATGSGTCDLCLQSRCCDVINACAALSECVETESCINASLDAMNLGPTDRAAAIEACKVAHATARAAYDAAEQCLLTSCRAACL